MAWSGGTFSRVHDWTTDAGSAINIEADRMDAEDDNFATGINSCLHKGGQNAATADLPMGGFNHTGVGNATALDEYASAADVIDQDLIYYVDSGTADTYVITPATPAITAYEEGQRFVFRATNANTGASTLNVNSLGATAIQTNDGSALEAGAIVVGGYYEVTYDANGSRFVMTSPASAVPTGMLPSTIVYTTGNNTFTGEHRIQNVAAAVWFQESDAAANNGKWYMRANNESFALLAANDAEDTFSSVMAVERTGTTIDSITFSATTVTVPGFESTDSPQFTAVNIGHATDTTVGREGAGQINVEGQTIFSHGTGQVNADYASARVFMSDSAPVAEGANGDIWFEY